MDSARFFRLAERCAAYPGVMRARVMAEQEKAESEPRGRESSSKPSTGRADPVGAAQRHNLKERGAEVASVASSAPSYLADRLKGRR